jgi:hypothetical protein
MPSLGLKDTKIVLPTADTIPISLNGGMPMPGWSDIYGLSDTDKEDEAGFNASAARVMARAAPWPCIPACAAPSRLEAWLR